MNFSRDNITCMINHVERIRTALLPLCEPLHDAFAMAEQVRRTRLEEVDGEPYRWFHTATVRAYAHLYLQRYDLDPWKVAGNHAQNGPIWITDGDYQFRLRHTYSEEHVPPPGHTEASRAYYRQPPLVPMQLNLFNGEPVPDDKLLGLWRVDPESGAVGFRIVRTIGSWKWGERAKTDLEFILPETAEDLENLQFDPDDRETDLELPGDDEEGLDDAGGVTG